MKESFKTSYELWYGYKTNVTYLKVFGSKCYILKESRKGKSDAKGDEEIFLRYYFKSKAYRYLNLSTHKVIESAHVKVDEFAKKIAKESKKEPEDYRRFIFIDTLLDTFVNKRIVASIATKLEIAPTESQRPKSQTKATESIAIKTE